MTNHQWEVLGETEKIDDQSDLNFTDGIIVLYSFEKLQKIKFLVTDGAVGGGEIGSLETTIGEIISAEESSFTGLLHNEMKEKVGTIIVSAKEIQVQNSLYEETNPLNAQREKSIRFKYRWENMNNWSTGFFGIGKERQRVRFEVGKFNPKTKNYSKIRSTPFVK